MVLVGVGFSVYFYSNIKCNQKYFVRYKHVNNDELAFDLSVSLKVLQLKSQYDPLFGLMVTIS